MKNSIKPAHGRQLTVHSKIPFHCLAFLLVAVGFVWAQDKKDLTVKDIAQKVEDAQGAIQDVQMDLDMQMKDSLSGSQQNVKGVVEIKSPDKVFVHYTQPSEQFLYIGGSLIQMYQPDQKMVYQQKNGDGKGAPLYIGVGKQLKKYIDISKVSIIKNSDSEVGLLLIPNDNLSAGFDRMKVFIHKKDWWPYQMEMETPSTFTKAHFSNLAFNKGLKDSLFQFAPPKGAQVVEGAIF